MISLTLRPALHSDAAELAALFTRSRNLLTFLPQLHTAAQDAVFMQSHVLQNCRVLVATDPAGLLGFIALQGAWVDHLYVCPTALGKGIGTQLLERAQAENKELRLWCFDQNSRARHFYEHHGFVIAEQTDGSGNAEKCPDMRYVWNRG